MGYFIQGDDLLLELLSKVLELFVQQGLEASKVQNKVEINVSVLLPYEHAYVKPQLFFTLYCRLGIIGTSG